MSCTGVCVNICASVHVGVLMGKCEGWVRGVKCQCFVTLVEWVFIHGGPFLDWGSWAGSDMPGGFCGEGLGMFTGGHSSSPLILRWEHRSGAPTALSLMQEAPSDPQGHAQHPLRGGGLRKAPLRRTCRLLWLSLLQALAGRWGNFEFI